ncbi:hypothetical protein [Streptomyces pacificus]|uniref:Uncharacterized protein n=1 Tax=Streptomyces pacificus TaxID=2705029 RepID=A0A6A0ATZ8_9ACTN|nr:hypothetical protein [Streptomyces pacificus]GFH35801.1 hypothetical protein SCWH03_20230 [Streptomyces pacificus]
MPIVIEGSELTSANIAQVADDVKLAVLGMESERGWTKEKAIEQGKNAKIKVGKYFGTHGSEDVTFSTVREFAERLLDELSSGAKAAGSGADREQDAADAIKGVVASGRNLPSWVTKEFSKTFEDLDPDIYAKNTSGKKDESCTVKADVLSEHGIGVVGPPSKFDKKGHTRGIFKMLGEVARSHEKEAHSFIYRGQKYNPSTDVEKIVSLTEWAREFNVTPWVEVSSGDFVKAESDGPKLRAQLK